MALDSYTIFMNVQLPSNNSREIIYIRHLCKILHFLVKVFPFSFLLPLILHISRLRMAVRREVAVEDAALWTGRRRYVAFDANTNIVVVVLVQGDIGVLAGVR